MGVLYAEDHSGAVLAAGGWLRGDRIPSSGRYRPDEHRLTRVCTLQWLHTARVSCVQLGSLSCLTRQVVLDLGLMRIRCPNHVERGRLIR